MTIKREFRKLLWRVGYDISRFTPASHPLARRKRLLQSYRIDTVIDIGANSGQFARQLREEAGYAGRILSFEPLTSAFRQLEKNASGDKAWQVFNFALGDAEEKCEINIAGNSYSSSLLDMLPSHLKSAPDSKYVGKEVIDIKTIDSVFSDLFGEAGNVYMKIDAQGYEARILKGAKNSLGRIGTVQMEMSLVPLYDGELLFNEMCMFMANEGYTLVAIEDGFSDPGSGQLLQVDGIFHRLIPGLAPAFA